MHCSLSRIRPELRLRAALLKAILPRFTVNSLSVLARIQARICAGVSLCGGVRYRQTTLSRPNGTKLRLCIYEPRTAQTDCVGLLWLHGGGYAIGVPEQDGRRFIKGFVQSKPCVVVAPDYTRAVDAPYPAALDDCMLALRWLVENAPSLGVSSERIFVGGNSAGGGLCAAVCLRARDEGDISLAFSMPLYPMLDDRRNTPSAMDNDAPVWDSAANEAGWRLYLGDAFDTAGVSKYAAPARETDYAALPPTLTFVGDIEPFYDETRAYMDRLQHAGVETRFRVFEGCFHAFDAVCPHTRAAKEARAFLLNGFCYAAAHYKKAQPDAAREKAKETK